MEGFSALFVTLSDEEEEGKGEEEEEETEGGCPHYNDKPESNCATKSNRNFLTTQAQRN